MEDRQAAVFLLVVSPAIGVWDDVRAITKNIFWASYPRLYRLSNSSSVYDMK